MAPCIARLADPRPAVRRIAALDVIRLGEAALSDVRMQIANALAQALQRETDPDTAAHLVRGLGQFGRSQHLPALIKVRDSTATPPQLAHDALLAVDRIEHRELSEPPRVS